MQSDQITVSGAQRLAKKCNDLTSCGQGVAEQAIFVSEMEFRDPLSDLENSITDLHSMSDALYVMAGNVDKDMEVMLGFLAVSLRHIHADLQASFEAVSGLGNKPAPAPLKVV